jgi:hypothetical protein
MNVQAGKAGQRAPRRPPEVIGSGAAQIDASSEQMTAAVAMAAYFIAEKRGFEPGHELDDWLAAEAQLASAAQPSVTKPIQPTKAENIS